MDKKKNKPKQKEPNKKQKSNYLSKKPETESKNEGDFLKDLEDGFETTTNFVQKKIIGEGYRQIFKDIEIRRGEILLLLIITLSTTTLGAISLYYSGNLINTSVFLGGGGLAAGIIIGIALSAVLVDRIEKKFPLLSVFYIVGPILNGVGIIIQIYTDAPLMPVIIFSVNAIIFTFCLITSIVLFINYTTMLERGRIIALILVLDFLYILAIIFLIREDFLAVIPGVVPLLGSYYLYRKKDEEKTFTYFTLFELQDAEKENIRSDIRDQMGGKYFFKFLLKNDKVILKYLVVIYTISMLVALMVPSEFYSLVFQQIGREFTVQREFVIAGPIYLSVGAFIIGLVFDFYGRKTTLSFLLLAIGVSNFVSLFQTGEQYSVNQLSLIMAIVFSLFLSISLINGELGRSEYYGRLITLFLIIIVMGLVTGAVIKDQAISELITIYPQIENRFFTEIRDFISSIIFLVCIISLFIMSNIQSTGAAEEQNWPRSLIHLYVIHNSGLLLYERSFRGESSFVTADLVSGGLIGLTSMLQEITRETQKLRIIDHGNKKLLFQWDENDQVVFVLVIERELVILRHKLSQFVRAFQKRFEDKLKNFKGVNTQIFKEKCDELVGLFFTRKYLEIIPGMAQKLGNK